MSLEPDAEDAPSKEGWVCPEAFNRERIDKFLSHHFPNVSRSKIQKWIIQNCVTVNGVPVPKNRVLEEGDQIILSKVPETEPTRAMAENIPLRIIYEDEDLAIIDKPKGMVVHPGHGNKSGTLANALLYRYQSLSGVNGPWRPGIVHRLDRDTSGLLAVAKNDMAHNRLAEQLSRRSMKRTYTALVWNCPDPSQGTYSAPIGRHSRNPTKKAVNSQGKAAVTHYEVLKYFDFAALLQLQLETGRTHQIRVHLSHAGHSVIGDGTYGGNQLPPYSFSPMERSRALRLLNKLKSQALHASSLSFSHPTTGKTMSFQSELPQEFALALALLGEP